MSAGSRDRADSRKLISKSENSNEEREQEEQAFSRMWTRSLRFSPLTDYSLFQGGRCLSCQFRSTPAAVLRSRQSLRYYASKSNDSNPTTTNTTNNRVHFNQNPSPSQPEKPGDENVTPPSLDRPIGSVIPPQEGQNTGVDNRSLGERRDDFVNYDRHIERRKELYAPAPLRSSLSSEWYS